MEATFPADEKERIVALTSLKILDTPPEEKFDRITRIAQIIFDVPIALVSLVDENRQWFKSCMGLSERETPRSMSFCAHAILNNEVMVIEDATKDPRFSDNELVTGNPYIKFYAGKPLRDNNNHMLGTLCIIDTAPRKLSKADTRILSDLATWVESEFSSIRLTNQLKESTQQLLEAESELRIRNLKLENQIGDTTKKLIATEKMSALGTMASRLAHDLTNPLTVIKLVSDGLSEKLESQMDDQMLKSCNRLKQAVIDMQRLIDDTLSYVKTSELNISENSFKEICKKSLQNIVHSPKTTIDLPENDIKILCDFEKMSAVISNLVSNAIDAIENSGQIKITVNEDSSNIVINVIDSGSGIPEEKLESIFQPLYTSKTRGTGLGLNICKIIVEQHNGEISVKNNPTTFSINLPKP